MRKQTLISISGAAVLAILLGGCGNISTVPSNDGGVRADATTPSATNADPRPTAAPTATLAPVVEASEPNSYSATVRLTATSMGKTTSLPPIMTKVARDGEKRRIAFTLPNNERVVYLNLGGTRYLIMPNRKQYAEIRPDDVAFEIPRLMMPDQIVDHLKNQKGFERVGEEQFNGRAAVKYRSARTTETNSQAGQINSESLTYVDKETGLPIRAELQSTAEGQVQGVEGFRTVIEMSDIETRTAPGLFEVPEGYNKITADQIRNQFTAFAQTVAAIAGALLTNMNAPKSTPSPQ